MLSLLTDLDHEGVAGLVAGHGRDFGEAVLEPLGGRLGGVEGGFAFGDEIVEPRFLLLQPFLASVDLLELLVERLLALGGPALSLLRLGEHRGRLRLGRLATLLDPLLGLRLDLPGLGLGLAAGLLDDRGPLGLGGADRLAGGRGDDEPRGDGTDEEADAGTDADGRRVEFSDQDGDGHVALRKRKDRTSMPSAGMVRGGDDSRTGQDPGVCRRSGRTGFEVLGQVMNGLAAGCRLRHTRMAGAGSDRVGTLEGQNVRFPGKDAGIRGIKTRDARGNLCSGRVLSLVCRRLVAVRSRRVETVNRHHPKIGRRPASGPGLAV